MNNNTTQRNSFSKLKRSMMLKVLIISLGSLAVGIIFLVVFVEGIFQGAFGAFMVGLFESMGMSIDDANNTYYYIFMNNKSVWLMAGLLIILSIAFYITLTRMTKYFDEVSDGVDKLVEGNNDTIHLSPELDFMEAKLNEVKNNLNQREWEAKEAEQRKNDLVVYLAHDIKTPLTSIVGYLNLLKESPDLPIESRAKYTDITLEKAYRLEELINEFFDITRFNLQSIVIEKTKVDLELMLRQIADEFYPSFEEKGITASLEFDENLIIDGDSQQLARVFNNIVKNAISYSHNDSLIEVNAKSDGDQVKISITNTGETIPKDKLDVIFEKFYRLDQSRSTDKGGSGLGLAIAKKIVNAHNGKIIAYSHKGKTTFTITLPK